MVEQELLTFPEYLETPPPDLCSLMCSVLWFVVVLFIYFVLLVKY
jgi:hypothetical protein